MTSTVLYLCSPSETQRKKLNLVPKNVKLNNETNEKQKYSIINKEFEYTGDFRNSIKRYSVKHLKYISNVVYNMKMEDVLKTLISDGYKIYHLENNKNGRLLHTVHLNDKKMAFVFGNEKFGCNDNIEGYEYNYLEIESAIEVNSLSVSQAVAMILHQRTLDLYRNPKL